MNKQQIETIVLGLGYQPKGYGFYKETENRVHWVTIFGEGEFQAYSYMKDDPDYEKEYDTGIIDDANVEELTSILNILVRNHD